MEDANHRFATLAVRAALACGGAFACLLLFAGPAQSEEPGPDDRSPSGGLSLAQVGEQVGAATRDLSRDAGDLVQKATEPVRSAAPVVDRTVEQADTTTAAVADGVERVTTAVDQVVDDVAPPPPDVPVPPVEPPAEPPVAEPPSDVPAPHEPRADGPRPHHDRAGQQERARVDVRATSQRAIRPPDLLGSPSTPTPASVTAPADASAVPDGSVPIAVPEAPGPSPLVAACDDDCAATSGPSGDPLHVLGLPSQGATTPRSVGDVPRDAAGGGPTTVFRRPDVSPD